jgi:hypothetical protein
MCLGAGPPDCRQVWHLDPEFVSLATEGADMDAEELPAVDQISPDSFDLLDNRNATLPRRRVSKKKRTSNCKTLSVTCALVTMSVQTTVHLSGAIFRCHASV